MKINIHEYYSFCEIFALRYFICYFHQYSAYDNQTREENLLEYVGSNPVISLFSQLSSVV